MPATMPPPTSRRLPTILEGAAQRVKLAARAATERTIEALGLAALASANVFQRDGLLEGQFELNRKSAMFALAFNEAFDERLLRECTQQRGDPGATNWDELSLVEDTEVERGVAAERFGMEVAHSCEWELRELGAYLETLMGGARDLNPLRPEAIGLAMLRGIETVSDRREVRELLAGELGRMLAREMQPTYQAIVADLRQGGVKPAGLSVRARVDHGRYTSGYDGLDERPPAADGRTGGRVSSRSGGLSSHGPMSSAGRFGPSTGGSGQGSRGTPLGHVDAHLMSLIRRLAYVEPMTSPEGRSGWDDSAQGMAPGNMIRAHREELRRAANGSLDHLVIDIIGTLFDQILSDPKVAPQMARQIARLQLPVLRAALGDATFFSSRRHPVRRFVNRLASLGAAFEDYAVDDAKRFMERVKSLVQDVVEGEFDQIEVYESKLEELERFIAELARAEVDAEGDATQVLERKEDTLRVQQQFATQLQAELKDLEGPPFVREFLTEVWSQVLVQAAARHGESSEAVNRLRGGARELFMSVQPKGTPAQRKEFLQRLPKLMQSLNEGMDLIRWPDGARKAFFGLLLPAHAESLKGQQGFSTLDYNLLARRVDGAFGTPMPQPASLPPSTALLPVLNDELVIQTFTAEEARRIGLLDEAQVDWDKPAPAAPQAEPAITEVDIEIDGLPLPEAVEPSAGKGLVEHMQIGVPYQMFVEDAWHRVKLAHMSPARTFYVFTRGSRHQKTISMTHRMLVKLCDTGRLRALESAQLLERATARARRQLATLNTRH